MSASVTVHHTAFGSERVTYLGDLAGYSRYEALGRLVCLWSRCTELQTDRPGITEIRTCLGRDGERHLLECGLAELLDDGTIRVKGCEGRIEWFAEMPAQQASAGKARAAGAKRDQRGRMLPSKLSSADQPQPASDPDLDLPEDQISLPRAIAQQAPERDESHETEPASTKPLPEAPEEKAEKARRERKQLHDETVQKLEAIRSSVAKGIGVEIRPLHFAESGLRVSLVERIRESELLDPTLARARADLAHVLAVAEAEARRDRSVQWLTGVMFDDRPYRRLLGMTLDDARKPSSGHASSQHGPRGSPPTAPTDAPRRIKTLKRDEDPNT